MAAAWVFVKTGSNGGETRPSWPVLVLLAAVAVSSLLAVTLYQLVALRAEVEGLLSEACRRRGDANQSDDAGSRRQQRDVRHSWMRKRRTVSVGDAQVSQPCLQMLADNSRKTYSKEFVLEPHTGIPWRTGLLRGSALEADNDTIKVKEEGFYFVYSQVFYMDSTFAMGHVLIRRKRNVAGDDPQNVVLFRCIQNMNPVYPYNTCYTGGVVKLEVGDHLELLIPRATANVSLDGDATFMGAVKLA